MKILSEPFAPRRHRYSKKITDLRRGEFTNAWRMFGIALGLTAVLGTPVYLVWRLVKP